MPCEKRVVALRVPRAWAQAVVAPFALAGLYLEIACGTLPRDRVRGPARRGLRDGPGVPVGQCTLTLNVVRNTLARRVGEA